MRRLSVTTPHSCNRPDDESRSHVEAHPVGPSPARALPVGGEVVVQHAVLAVGVAGALHPVKTLVLLSEVHAPTLGSEVRGHIHIVT